MKLKLENIVLFLMVATDCSRTVLSFDPKCPPLKLVRGRSRYQWRGRSVRFNCMRGYQLVGVKYATCMDGKWDADVPICVKYGCRVPSTTHVNGQFIESYRGAVVKIVCNPGYSLIGSPNVYCNGIRWNETFPVCRVTNSNPALTCNFEDEDLCGWSQDPMHDFDWKRRNNSTTYGEAVSVVTAQNSSRGYYMYIDSSSSMVENDTVRLFSPVYPPENSKGTCFKFWYRMHGNTTGFLKVYVKPEGTELWNVIPSFWMYGDQGTSWVESSFSIESMVTPFQIVVEGGRGPGAGAVGDIAFDGVSLSPAEECPSLETTSSSSSSSEATFSYSPGEYVLFPTCLDQCGQVKVNGTSPDMGTCSCDKYCDRDGTCCYDYFEYCTVTPSSPTPTGTTQTDAITSESTSFPSTLTSVKLEKDLPSPNPSSKRFNNESNEINPEKPVAQIPPQATLNRTSNEIPRQQHLPTSRTTPKSPIPLPQPKTTTTRNDTDSKTVIGATKTANRKIAKVVLPRPATSRPKSQKVPAHGAEVNAQWNEIPRGDVRPGLGGKAKAVVVLKSTSVTSSSTATTPARVFKNPNPNNIKLTFLEKPSRPILPNDSRFTKGKPKEVSGKEPPQAIKIDKNEGNGGIPIKEIVEFGGAALLVLVVMIVGFFWYKRRAIRKSERDSMVEDSDSIVYEMDSSTLGSEYHSLVCIRPGGLGQSL